MRLSLLDENGTLFSNTKDKKVLLAQKILSGEDVKAPRSIKIACRIYSSERQRNIIESLLISDDGDTSFIEETIGIPRSAISAYKHIFFRMEEAFLSKLDLLDYIEDGISLAMERGDDVALNSFLLKRWASVMGRDFIVWKFRLSKVDYSQEALYDMVMTEAFFYHKEKAMGKDDIPALDYLKSAKLVLDAIKSKNAIKTEKDTTGSFSLLEDLDIIIKDTPPPDKSIEELGGAENFIINN